MGHSCLISAGFWDDQNGTLAAQAHHHALRNDELGSDSQSYRLLSRSHNAHQRWDESWDCIQRALRMDPNDGDVIGSRGHYHLFHGEFGEAMDWFDKVLEMHTDTPHTVDIMRYWKALALFATTEYAAAATLLRSISGYDFLKVQLLAACHVRLGEIDKAQAQAAEVLRIYPTFRLQNIHLWRNFRNKSDGQNFLEVLREAGLPD
jgi:adenylate cyclase